MTAWDQKRQGGLPGSLSTAGAETHVQKLLSNPKCLCTIILGHQVGGELIGLGQQGMTQPCAPGSLVLWLSAEAWLALAGWKQCFGA